MTLVFSDPSMLWMLAAVPLALLLAILMRRERRVATASLRPWRAVLSLPRPRPHRSPLDRELVCTLLAVGLAALALADPLLRQPLRDERRVHVVVDDSIRMRARGGEDSTRWEMARAALEELQASFPAAEATLFLLSENRPTTTRQRLDSLRLPPHPSDTPPDPVRQRAFLTTVLEAAAEDGAAVVWISDRESGVEDARLETMPVGTPVPNQAILMAEWSRIDPPSIFLALGNFSADPFSGQVHVRQDDTEHRHLPVTLSPGETRSVDLELPAGLAPHTPLTIRLLPDADAMPEDNATTLPAPASLHVRIPDTLSPRLALGLEAAGLLPVREGEDARFEVVQDGAILGRPEVILLVEPGEAVHGILTHGRALRIRAARVTAQAEGLPGMAAEGLAGARVPGIQRPPGSRVLLEAVTEDGAVEAWVADWEWEGRQVMYIAGLPDAWTERAAFPVTLTTLLAPHLPSPSSLPGVDGSDTMRAIPPSATGLPTLSAGDVPVREWQAARFLTGLALLFLLVPLMREYRRVRVREVLRVGT